MAPSDTAVIILAAGMGTRMKSALPKVLHALAGRPLIGHVMDVAATLKPHKTVLVLAPGMDDVAEAATGAVVVLQEPQLGTGHAVLTAREALVGFSGTVLVLYGDTPLVRGETLANMVAAREAGAAVVVLGFRPIDAGGYGRLVVSGEGGVEAIIEHKDANAGQQNIGLCNSGVMAVDGGVLFELLENVGNDNAKGEFYLTDIVAEARKRDLHCAVVEAPEDEVLGINSRAQLADAEAILQDRPRAQAMAEGATLTDPDTVYFSADTALGRDVTVEPNVFFGPGVEVGDGAVVRAFSHLEGATVSAGAQVGPFARLRPGTEVGAGARIGNFVEVKKSVIEEGAKVNHLTYIGDARVGAGANVGAGTITCNYDGFMKHQTDIGAGASIGSNTSLVAPVKIGDGAITGAGTVVTGDVPTDALVVNPADQKQTPGFAAGYRDRKTREKEGNK